ncbi:MAG: hypothetical protein IPK92_19725 [Nitrospira sp.]|jgi:hypothetical protein|nr:hypothetical protein [Nitrospira sp.]
MSVDRPLLGEGGSTARLFAMHGLRTPAAQDDRQASDMVKTSASVLRSRLFIPWHMVHKVVPVAILPLPLYG